MTRTGQITALPGGTAVVRPIPAYFVDNASVVVATVLDQRLDDYGVGDTDEEAATDLAASIAETFAVLTAERQNLGPKLVEELAALEEYLCRS
jgi:hypothetical protein